MDLKKDEERQRLPLHQPPECFACGARTARPRLPMKFFEEIGERVVVERHLRSGPSRGRRDTRTAARSRPMMDDTIGTLLLSQARSRQGSPREAGDRLPQRPVLLECAAANRKPGSRSREGPQDLAAWWSCATSRPKLYTVAAIGLFILVSDEHFLPECQTGRELWLRAAVAEGDPGLGR